MFGIEEEEVVAAPVLTPEEAAVALRIAPHLDELVERIERPQRRFPIERAVLLSVIVHLLVLILVLVTPGRQPPREDPIQRSAQQIPAELWSHLPTKAFEEAPGPARQNSRKNLPLSDKTRVAGGGDRAKPKTATPFVAPARGIEGLAPGQRGRSAAPPPSPRQQQARSASAAPATGAENLIAPNGTTGSPAAPITVAGGQSSAQSPNRAPTLQEAIRSAAGNPFAGEGGAPRANPDGGFVDSGPLSFDTQWYDWGEYAEEMVRRIKLHWDVPDLARVGTKGKLTIRFFIRADGVVEDARIIRSSGIPPFDHASLQAILTSNPFRPLPADLHEAREGVTVTFLYNMHPGKEQ